MLGTFIGAGRVCLLEQQTQLWALNMLVENPIINSGVLLF